MCRCETVAELCRVVALQSEIIRRQNEALEQLGAVCCEEQKAAADEAYREAVGDVRLI